MFWIRSIWLSLSLWCVINEYVNKCIQIWCLIIRTLNDSVQNNFSQFESSSSEYVSSHLTKKPFFLRQFKRKHPFHLQAFPLPLGFNCFRSRMEDIFSGTWPRIWRRKWPSFASLLKLTLDVTSKTWEQITMEVHFEGKRVATTDFHWHIAYFLVKALGRYAKMSN